MFKSYIRHIENKDIKSVFETFNENLSDFMEESDDIYTSWHKLNEEDKIDFNYMKIRYNKLWNDFVSEVPFEFNREYIDKDNPSNSIRISQLLSPTERLDGNSSKLNSKIIIEMSRYSAYLLFMEGRLMSEIHLWYVLNWISKVFDLTNISILPSKVKDIVSKVFDKFQNGNIDKPLSTFYCGEIYEYGLSNSASKAFVRRQNIFDKFIESCIINYKNEYGYYPTKKIVKDYINKVCMESDVEELKIFRKGMNDKTFNKICRGYKSLLKKRDN